MSMGSSTSEGEHSSQHHGLKGKGNLLPWFHPEHQFEDLQNTGEMDGLFSLFCDTACKGLNTAETMETCLKEPIYQKLMEFCPY